MFSIEHGSSMRLLHQFITCLSVGVLANCIAVDLSAQAMARSTPVVDEALLSADDTVEVPTPTELAQAEAGFRERHPRYRLHVSDTVALSFPFTPEFDQTLTVQPDGYVALRVVGDLHVEGKTVPEFHEMLKESYKSILKDPNIRVELESFQQPYFVVGGEVKNAGKYELRDSTTVAEAVSIAGGLMSSSKHSQVLLFRVQSEKWVRVTPVNLKRLFGKGDLSEDPQLRPGDLVYVPKNALSKIKEFFPRASLTPW